MRPTVSSDYFAHESAVIDPGSQIGAGTRIWHFCHIMPNARVGRECTLGQNVFVATDAVVGNRVKIQNNVSVFKGCVLEDDVFLGPSCVLTNVVNPRAHVERKDDFRTTLVRCGATIGANATILCGVTIGRYAFIGAGAVVAKDVPDYALMVGIPARRVGWMSRHGHPIKPGPDGIVTCPESGMRYEENDKGVFRCLDLDEDEPLPENLHLGQGIYDEYKSKGRQR